MENLSRSSGKTRRSLLSLRDPITYVLKTAETSHRRSDLIAESVSRLILAAVSLSPSESNGAKMQDRFLDDSMLSQAKDLFAKWLRRNELEVIDTTSDAASSLLGLLNAGQQQVIISSWIDIVSETRSGGRHGQDKGVISVLLKAFPDAGSTQGLIINAVHERWNAGHDIETRVAILKYLTLSAVLRTHARDFSGLISEGMDDYTTNARGDVGSLVRIEAVKAAGVIWKDLPPDTNPFFSDELSSAICGKAFRLAAEKLDKVRAVAQPAIACLPFVSDVFETYTTSSNEYFRHLLDLQAGWQPFPSQWSLEIFEGYVGSADTGSEDLVRASRAALVEYCECGNTDLVCETLLAVCFASMPWLEVPIRTYLFGRSTNLSPGFEKKRN